MALVWHGDVSGRPIGSGVGKDRRGPRDSECSTEGRDILSQGSDKNEYTWLQTRNEARQDIPFSSHISRARFTSGYPSAKISEAKMLSRTLGPCVETNMPKHDVGLQV